MTGMCAWYSIVNSPLPCRGGEKKDGSTQQGVPGGWQGGRQRGAAAAAAEARRGASRRAAPPLACVMERRPVE